MYQLDRLLWFCCLLVLTGATMLALFLMQVVKFAAACSRLGWWSGVDVLRALVHCCSVTLFQVLAGGLGGLRVGVWEFLMVK